MARRVGPGTARTARPHPSPLAREEGGTASFVGRREELSEIGTALRRSRLLTLTGMGGAGKTRLAVQAADSVRRRFPDGVRFAGLANQRDPALLAQAVAAGLGMRDHSGVEPLTALIDHLAPRRLLLVLDNCEQLVQSCAGLAGALLAGCPELRILATSRQPLGVPGESVLRLAPLPFPGPDDATSAADAGRYDAVRLFVERARAAAPRFRLADSNAAAVAEVCRRLDGIPLALELAAARLDVLAVEQVRDRLDDRFRLLRRSGRTPVRRHRALRAAIDWSFDLLSEPERQLARRLAAFAGSFDLQAAEAVCAGSGVAADAVLGLQANLVEKSLVHADGRRARMRYRLGETIRQYCEERLRASGEEAETLARHQRWYADMARSAFEAWLGPAQGTWLERVEDDRDNLRAAIERAGGGSEPDTALGMAADLWLYWYARGRLGEGRHVLERLLARPGPATLPRARAMGVLGYLRFAQGDVAAGRPLADAAVTLARPHGDPLALGELLVIQGLGARAGGEPERAAALFEEGLACYRTVGDPARIGVALSSLAGTALDRGDVEAARALQTQSCAFKRQAGDDWNLAFSLFDLAIVSLWESKFAEATDLLRESLRLRRRLDDRRGIAASAEAMGWVAAAAGDHVKAASLLGAAARLWDAIPARLAAQWLPVHTACEERCREALGEARFAQLANGGAKMRVDALLGPDAVPGSARPGGSGLTRREAEVAELLGLGLSNREIAARLGVAPRTAESHVEHILAKLGLDSRVQVAAWAARRGQANERSTGLDIPPILGR